MRKTVKAIANELRDSGFDACGLQGGMEAVARDATLDAFRRERFQLLVATNVAARGLDVEHISHVMNYDIPEDPDVYTHRLGRTGRSGREGAAYTLVTPRDQGSLKQIEHTIGYEIDRRDLSST
jgi:superfamily II DNA/RNA helicase